jgi:hypothetical protein
MRSPIKSPLRLICASMLVLGYAGAPARADVVTDWNATGQAAILATPGQQYAVVLALMHAAVYDAVNAIGGGYGVFAVSPATSARGASKEAAAAAAAHTVLLHELPGQQVALDAAYAASLAAIPNGSAKTLGVAIGGEVATAWLAQRQGDGRNAAVPYVYGTEPGTYQATPPAFAPAVTPWLAKMRPFVLASPAQFRAYGPPDLTSARFAKDFEAVRILGSATSTERTATETEIALFHTAPPPIFWPSNTRAIALSRNLGLTENARFFAMVFVAHADATIACWDSKYYFSFWRPVTAIRAADTDNNPATVQDSAWTPLAVTPPHPEYPAAHGCAAAAYAETLDAFFGPKRFQFTMTSTVAGTVPHAFYNTDQFVEEVMDARVFGGMHYPTSVEHGATMGRQVAREILRARFKPVGRPRH